MSGITKLMVENTWHVQKSILVEVDETHEPTNYDEDQPEDDEYLKTVEQEDDKTSKNGPQQHLTTKY